MPTYTITATCGGETQTALVHVPGEPPERIIRVTAAQSTVARSPGGIAYTINWPAATTAPTIATLTPDDFTRTWPAGAIGQINSVTHVDRNGTYRFAVTNADWPVEPPYVDVVIDNMLTLAVTGQPSLTVTATGTTTAGFPPTVNSATFDWGDGTQSNIPLTEIHTVSAQHTYATGGTYTVTVSAFISGEDSQTINVIDTRTPGRLVLRADVTRDPIARIWIDDVPPDVDQVTIEWGDESTQVVTRAEGFTTTHEYDANGDYTVIARAPGLEHAQTIFNIGDAEDTIVVSWARRAADDLAFHQATGLPATDTSARIEWGDGTTTDVPAADGKAGDLTQPPTATHTYARGRSYHARVVSLPSGRTSPSLTITV